MLGTLVAGSIIGLYYYLRIIVTMAAPAADSQSRGRPLPSRELQTVPAGTASGNSLGHGVLAALVLLLIGLGAYPTPLLTLIRATASMVAR